MDDRFAEATVNIIEQLKQNAKNVNTSKSTMFWISVFFKWAGERKVNTDIEKMEPGELNKVLEKFYAEVKNQKGEDYEPESLKVMLAAVDRYLRDKGYKYSIIKDREFSSSKQVLEGKARELRKNGKGKRPNKARQLSKEEEEVLWEQGKLGPKTPQCLIHTVWWLLTQYFGLRGRQEHHAMKMEDFLLDKDDHGIEFVQFTEGPTKTRQSGLHSKSRDFQPRMFATGGPRCPVALFKEYIHHRPKNMQKTGPFYLSVKHNANDEIWYKVQPMGVNKIDSMMKDIIAGTALEESSKKFTNHSARKTLVGKMKKAMVESSAIAKVTGHKNIQSLDDYDEANTEEQRLLSSAISKRNNAIDGSALLPLNTNLAMNTTNSQAQNMFSFHNCEVHFFSNNSKPAPRKRLRILESDSDSD